MQARKLTLNPLYSLHNEKVFDSFDHVTFDEEAKILIAKSTHDTRHAVVGWIPKATNDAAFYESKEDKQTGVIPLISRIRPSIRIGPTPEEIQAATEKYGPNLFVIPNDPTGAAGVVHIQTIEQVEKNEPALLSGYQYIGLSFTVLIKDHQVELEWLNRSAQNLNIFKRDPLALACLTFKPDDNITERPSHTLEYHLNRSVPYEFFKRYLMSAAKSLRITCGYRKDECYSFEYETYWEDLRKMEDKEKQEKIITYLLMTNVYIAASLPADPDHPSKYGGIKNGYELNLNQILAVAKNNNIALDLEAIPKKFAEETHHATALIMAAKQGLRRTMEILVSHGADIYAKDDQGLTALIWAVKEGHIDVIEFLLERDPDLLKTSIDQYGNTPLLLAAKSGQFKMIEFLMNKEGVFDAKAHDSEKLKEPIYQFIVEKTSKSTTSIIEKGIFLRKIFLENPDAIYSDMLTREYPGYDHTPLIKIFVQALSEFLLQNDLEGAELYLTELPNEVIQQIINPTLTTPPLVTVVNAGNLKAIEFLIKKGSDANAENIEGNTPLLLALYKKHPEAAKLLIPHSDVNYVNPKGHDALFLAATNGNFDVVELLIQKGAFVNNTTTLGKSSLYALKQSAMLVCQKLAIEEKSDQPKQFTFETLTFVKKFISQFESIIQKYPDILWKKQEEVPGRPVLNNPPLIAHVYKPLHYYLLENSDINNARMVLNDLPPAIVKILIDEKDSSQQNLLEKCIKQKNRENIHLLIEKGAAITVDMIKQCDDVSLRMDMLHWATMHNAEFKIHTFDKLKSVSFSFLQKTLPEEEKFNKYMNHCEEIQKLGLEKNISSPRYQAMNTLLDVAKNISKEAFAKEIKLFSELDSMVSKSKPELKEKMLALYTEYAASFARGEDFNTKLVKLQSLIKTLGAPAAPLAEQKEETVTVLHLPRK